MSEQNKAVIERVYAAFNAGDIQTVLANMTSDAEWINYGPAEVPYCGNFTGRIMDFFMGIAGSSTEGRVTVERWRTGGDLVVSEGVFSANVNGSPMEAAFGHVFTLSEGKISCWHGYGDTAVMQAAHSGKAAAA